MNNIKKKQLTPEEKRLIEVFLKQLIYLMLEHIGYTKHLTNTSVTSANQYFGTLSSLLNTQHDRQGSRKVTKNH